MLDQYAAFSKRSRRGKILIAVAILDVGLLEAIAYYFPLDIRSLAAAVLGVISVVLLFVGARYYGTELSFFLPEIEDRLLCFLKLATDARETYVAYKKPQDKKKVLKNLKRVADLLDDLYVGNLRFIKEGPIGTKLKDMQMNFRYGLLPAITDQKNTNTVNAVLVIDNMEKTLEQTNAISDYIFETWSKMLSEFRPTGPQEPFWRKLPTKKSHILKGLVTAVVTLVAGAVGLSINPEAGYLGTISMFGIMVLILVSTRERRKED